MPSFAPVLLEGGGAFDPLAFDPSAFWLTLVLFLSLLALLGKFAWNPILNALDAREKRIEDAVSGAEKARAEAERLVNEQNEKLLEIERSVATRIEESKAAAERQARDIVDKATKEASDERDRALRDIDLERKRALSEIRAESVRIAQLIAEKVVQREINDEDHQKLADEVLASIR